ncbi:unnamed protein product [Darwinula stevensoni]|uniref:Uncharacterized protein n=1 Tax=Darwinula stevensoni TaxID=69355 RepID=A0A7R9FPD6_9CRUS|nr:unnamed protein product [Darwinula stevensoni]CAG0897456.1 unnamed protein product [Darwinula stevensoni]
MTSRKDPAEEGEKGTELPAIVLVAGSERRITQIARRSGQTSPPPHVHEMLTKHSRSLCSRQYPTCRQEQHRLGAYKAIATRHKSVIPSFLRGSIGSRSSKSVVDSSLMEPTHARSDPEAGRHLESENAETSIGIPAELSDEDVEKDDEEPKKPLPPWKRHLISIGKFFGILVCLYFFICSLDLLASSFRLLGGRAAGEIFKQDVLQNPVVGVVIGILATVLVQSSSTSTSIVVSMVTSGIMEVRQAIPIIMGANIGTSVTNTVVSFGQVANREEFERAFAGATVHDMFNWLTVIVLLPIELITRYLETLSDLMTKQIHASRDSDIKMLSVLTEPFTERIVQLDPNVLNGWAGIPEYQEYATVNTLLKSCNFEKCGYLFEGAALADSGIGAILLVISLILMIGCLLILVKILNSILQGSIATAVRKYVNSEVPHAPFLAGYIAIAVGAFVTFIVQSSSVFTSTLTPLVGLGVVSLDRMYPLTLGSNIGTTSTAILAALASDSRTLKYALQAAFCHLLFNLSGILLFYVIPFMRFPIPLAKLLGRTTAKYRWFAIFYLIVMFILVPAFVFGLSLAGSYVLMGIGIPLLIVIFVVSLINLIQAKKPHILPPKLQNWDFLPIYLHSFQPYDDMFMRIPCCHKCRKAKEESEKVPEKMPPSSHVEHE